MASKKVCLQIINIIKIRTKELNTMLVMLLRMVYLPYNNPNVSKYAFWRILKISGTKIILSASVLGYNCQTHLWVM